MSNVDIKNKEIAIQIRKRIINAAYIAEKNSRNEHDKWHSIRNAVISVLRRSIGISQHGDCPVKIFHFAVRIADDWGTKKDTISDNSIERSIKQFIRMKEAGKLIQQSAMCESCLKDVPQSKIVKNNPHTHINMCMSCFYAEYAVEPVKKPKPPKTGGLRPRPPKSYKNVLYVYTINNRFDRIVFPTQDIKSEYLKNKDMFLYIESNLFDGVEFYHKIDISAGTTHYANNFEEAIELMERLQS